MRRYLDRLLAGFGAARAGATVVATGDEPGNEPGGKPTTVDNKARRPLFEGADEIPFAPLPVKRHSDAMPALPVQREASAPLAISVVVVVYRMPEQAMNTVRSLMPPYQRDIEHDDYEVLVVENASDDQLDPDAVTALGANVHYELRQETQPTPVHAANAAIERARGELVCLLIDGARMVTPGLLSVMVAAGRSVRQPIIATPSYHLGPKVQQRSMLEGYDRTRERELLAGIGWPADGYRLFEISCLSRTSMGGVFRPFGESNCLAVPRSLLQSMGGFDVAFTATGGGQANLDLYKRLVEAPGSQLIVLPGEGSFHQFHGGVTTGQAGEQRRQAMVDHFAQYAALRGGPYVPPAQRPLYFGAVPDSAVRFVRNSGNMLLDTLQQESQAK